MYCCTLENIHLLNRSARQYFQPVKLYMKFTTSVPLATGSCILRKIQFSFKHPITLCTDQHLGGWRQTPGWELTFAKHVSELKVASPWHLLCWHWNFHVVTLKLITSKGVQGS